MAPPGRFAFTLFLGAGLLFLVQPMVARALLPWFGGSAAVWTTCQLFFQLLLLGGYAWTHGLVQRLTPRHQVFAQRALVAVAALSILGAIVAWGGPIIPGVALRPRDSTFPIPRLLLTLLLCVGLPYFALATTGPLLQSWASDAKVTAGSVYRLYALSNAGSLLGLLAYPFVLEPLATLRVQGWLWAGGFAAWAVGVALAGRGVEGAPAQKEKPKQPGPLPVKSWLALSAGPVVLLLALTSHLTQEVAPIPFLWVLPMVLYLLSFIVTFESERWYRRQWVLPALAVLSVCVAGARRFETDLPIVLRVWVYLVFLFVACVASHGELVRKKPEPARLTGFYTAMAIGGALGGTFAGLLAPALFADLFEFELGFVFLLGAVAFQQDTRVLRRGAFAVIAVVTVLVALDVGRGRRGVIASRRDFFGVLRVMRLGGGDNETNLLRHGNTVHGAQLLSHPDEPTTYYVRESGVGQLLSLERAAPRRVGVIGLGIGTVAAYGRVGDVYRFYEISQNVLAIAQGEGGWFSFVSRSKATLEFALGDARTSLEREPPQRFDVMVLDAFSSDSVPVHLLTTEAMALYLRHLGPGGVLAVHLSNRSLDLVPVACRVGKELGLTPLVIGQASETNWRLPSVWLMLVRAKDYPSLKAPAGLQCDGSLWTDDFAPLWPAVRW